MQQQWTQTHIQMSHPQCCNLFFPHPLLRKPRPQPQPLSHPLLCSLSPHLCRFPLGAENVLEPPFPYFSLALSTGNTKTTACTLLHWCCLSLARWHWALYSDAVGDGCPHTARGIGSGMGRMIDAACKFLFCQSFTALFAVKPNHSAIALPQSYMMPSVYQTFHLIATMFADSTPRVVQIPSA